MSKIAISLTVNGEPRQVLAEPREQLADLLRGPLMLTGTHVGCEHGVCGACTVEIDGVPARSCITHAGSCDGAVDPHHRGLRRRSRSWPPCARPSPREHALQCGYCTPGMLVAARDIVLRLPEADEARVREEMAGNLCRCTGYRGIVRAVLGVLADRRGRRSDAP